MRKDSAMGSRANSYFVVIVTLFFSSTLFAYTKFPANLYIGLSGGYGETQNSYQTTGVNSLIRFAIGSSWIANPSLTFGEEIGFQTGNQVRLDSQVTGILGDNIVPVFLNIKTPVDFLLMGRLLFYEPVFFQAKGGLVFIGSTVTGADIQATNAWLPEVQLGMGIHLSENSRIILNYQQFFGSEPVITLIDVTQGTSKLTGMPNWHGGLLTLELSL